MPPPSAVRIQAIALSAGKGSRTGLGPTYGNLLTDKFYCGPENPFLLELFRPGSVKDLVSRSPVVLYGGSGVGKSALAHTLAQRFLSLGSDRPRLMQTTGTDFARHFVQAIEADDVEHFRRRHRGSRLLLIDEVQALEGKPAVQEELLRTLDELEQQQRVVIFTSSVLPMKLRGLSSGLISRLSAGWSVEVHPPGVEARAELIVHLAQKESLPCAPDQAQRLAVEIANGTTCAQIRSLLLQVAHHQRMRPEAEASALWQEVLDQHRAELCPSISEIAKAAARHFRLRLADLRGESRQANMVKARGLAMLLARQQTGMSLQQIGDYFGGRDHTTVLHAVRKLEGSLAEDSGLRSHLESVRQRLGLTTAAPDR
jgi:chromosomal replication initiator protein